MITYIERDHDAGWGDWKKKMFPVEFLTKELQKNQPTYFSNIFLSEVFNRKKIMRWEGSMINVGSYFYITL